MEMSLRIASALSDAMLQTMLLLWTGAVLLIAGMVTVIRSQSVKPGMSEDEVRETLGRPTKVARSSARAKWIYDSRSRPHPTVVSFQSGRVSQVRRPR